MRQLLVNLAIFVLIVTCVAIGAFVIMGMPVANAAPPATSDNCTLVATVEGISTYYCESDLGQPWKQNSAGFMLDED